MRRLLLCSFAFPWDEAITGSYNLAQAKALQEAGWEVRVFKPIPRVPRLVSRVSRRAARWVRHPEHYEIQGVGVVAPRVWFTFAPVVRSLLARIAPTLVSRWFRLTIRSAFNAQLRSFKPDALVLHSTFPWAVLNTNLPRVLIERDAAEAESWRASPRLRKVVARWGSGAQAHFASGRLLAELLNEILPDCRFRYLPNGAVTPTEQQFGSKPPSRLDNSYTILCVGSYAERKGHRILVEALTSLPDSRSFRLLLVREPPRELVSRISELGLTDVVEVLPEMPQDELLQYMVWADLFVLPSWAEAFGNVYAEAMAAGTPVVMTSDCGMAEEIEHRVHGWIVEPRNVESLREALLEAMEADLDAMGEAGRQLVAGRFSWERNARVLTNALTESSGQAAYEPN